jgi:hypothetical protein
MVKKISNLIALIGHIYIEVSVARVTIKKITPIVIFKLNQKLPGIKIMVKILNGGNHPPKNKIAEKDSLKAY